MATHKVGELEGALLDAAVAKAEGLTLEKSPSGIPSFASTWDPEGPCNEDDLGAWKMWLHYKPSSNWADGGPIIERNDWLLPYRTQGPRLHLGAYTAQTPSGFEYSGPTPLIAAMRAYVASKFGETVELPE